MTDSVPYETIGFRAPVTVKTAAAADAERLKLTTAEYGRMAFGRLLADEVSLADADPWRSPPTKKELRAAERASRGDGSGATSGGEPAEPSGRGNGADVERTLARATRAHQETDGSDRSPIGDAPLARRDVEPIPKTTGRKR